MSLPPYPSPSSSSPLAVAAVGSGARALEEADQSPLKYVPDPPQLPNDVHLIAGPGCGRAIPTQAAGQSEAWARLSAADEAGWKAGAFGCGTAYLTARVAGGDESRLFEWTLGTGRKDTQVCQVSVDIPWEAENPNLGAAGAGGGRWASAAVYHVSTPAASHQVVIDQHQSMGTWVGLAKDVTVGAGQSIMISLSVDGQSESQGLTRWGEALVASDVAMDCRLAKDK